MKKPAFHIVLALCSIALFFGCSIDEAYSSGYDKGYDYGYDVGYANAEQDAYAKGYDIGYEYGHSVGYDQGWNRASSLHKASFTTANGDVVTPNSQRLETSTVKTVYITETGTKYHTRNCSYLNDSKIATSISKAIENGYSACSRCY